MKKCARLIAVVGVSSWLAFTTHGQAQFTVLHNFYVGGVSDGRTPVGDLILSNSVLYGATAAGGSNDCGTVFKMNVDGTGFQILHHFACAPDDGSSPHGPLVLSGSTLYGMTLRGGSSDTGAVFQVNTDGSGYNILHSFGGINDGVAPYGSLTLMGSTLYGMTYGGGTYANGTIFDVSTNGLIYGVMHDFAGSAYPFSYPNDGAYPMGSLLPFVQRTIPVSTFLYGTTTQGGTDDLGTVFKINTDGSGFTLLHFFGIPGDGRTPNGSLVRSGSTLYGMTSAGGTNDLGTVFGINTDGTGYRILHDFGGAPEGSNPAGLELSGSWLYGMTIHGGSFHATGTVFQINVDGASFNTRHTFNGQAGFVPTGRPVVSGSTLYGMTELGGTNGAGVIFALNLAPIYASGDPVSIEVGVPNNEELMVYTGALFPCTWSLISGNLPAGLNLGANGFLAGTTTVMTNVSFRVRITGADGLYSETNLNLQTYRSGMKVTNAQVKVNFAKSGTDTCKLKAIPQVDQCTNWLGTAVTLDCGNAAISWTLDKKGRGVSTNGTCRFSYNKRTQTCTFSANLSHGNWRYAWPGMVNDTIHKPGLEVDFFVWLFIGDEAFEGGQTLLYTAKAGKSGTAK